MIKEFLIKAHGQGAGKMFNKYLKKASPEVVKNGLTLWIDGHDFDNKLPTTTLRDRSGLGNNGACTNFANTATSGATANSGIFFTGDDLITVTNNATLISDYITVEARIRVGAAYPALTATMMAKETGNSATPWAFTMTATGGIQIFIGASIVLFSSGVQPLNTTVHVTWTYDGVNNLVYINGKLDNTSARTGALPTAAVPVTIGNATTTIRAFENTIYTERLYNRALTAAEVLQNYSADKNNS
jgi:hypothetical protein